ncbi:lipopolysaccharide heptosyltransferase II [bacterium]|nr:lipopolysaccharide heptosyltransferase II [candidate division CSSED10-310 bacterium]
MGSLIAGNERLLIRMPNWIGDVVMSTAGLVALKRLYPDISITVLVKPWVVDVLKHHTSVENIMIYSPRRSLGRFLDVMRIASEVRKRRFSAYMLFQNNFESALIGWLSGIPIRFGRPTDRRRVLLTHPVELPEQVTKSHQVNDYLSLVESFTGSPAPVDCHPHVFLTEADRNEAENILRKIPGDNPLITISAGAAYGSAKCWPVAKFAAFVEQAVSRWNARIVFLGSQEDSIVSQRILDLCRVRAYSIAGQYPLLTQAAVIERAGLCVSNDSGLMHLAAALDGVSTVAIFGPTKPLETAPFGTGHVILHHPVACWPCRYRECPLGHMCMEEISVVEVIDAVETVLGKR